MIERFSIFGLFGKKDVDLVFKGKTQIYIGENGLGKTTMLNALNYLLQCDFKNLVQIRFSRIDIALLGEKYSFSKEELTAYIASSEGTLRRNAFYQRMLADLSDTDLKKLRPIIHSGESEMVKLQEVVQYLKKIGINITAPSGIILEAITQVVSDRLENKQIDSFVKTIHNWNGRILYLPTYRRIEKDVRTMLRERRGVTRQYGLRGLEEPFIDELSKSVHSGMSDIKAQRDDVLQRISDISRRELDGMAVDLLKSQIAGVAENIKLEKQDKDKIRTIISRSQFGLKQDEQQVVLKMVETDEINNSENKFLLLLLTKLKEIYDSYEVYDKGIKTFVEVCNGYLRDKQFTYNEADLKLDLEFAKQEGQIKEVIDLDQLSSGEKQLIALFASIYLEPQRHFVMLIDEPELSLSIFWQRKLLPDVAKSPNCDFLFAVTHSPFIFENELRDSTTGMNEFVRP